MLDNFDKVQSVCYLITINMLKFTLPLKVTENGY